MHVFVQSVDDPVAAVLWMLKHQAIDSARSLTHTVSLQTPQLIIFSL